MNIERRSGAPSTFTWLLGLTLGATCAAMTPACSASSGAALSGGWGQSGGGPLGSDTSSGGGGDDASSGSSQPINGMDAAPVKPASDAGVAGDATMSGDGGVLELDAAGDAPTVDGGVTGPDFTLLDTAIITVIDGSPVAGFDPIAPGATINLAKVGSALSIRANTIPALAGSVAFALDATYTHIENTVPYTLCSDNGAGTVTSCAAILTVGVHTLTATPYSAASLGGDAGAPFTLAFTIVNIDAGAGDSGIKDATGQ